MFFPCFPPWFSLMFFRWCCPSACCWWTSASSVAWCWQWIPWRTRTHYTAFGSACCGANGWKIRPMSVLIGRISGETSGDFFWLVVSNIFFIFHNIYIYFWMWTLTGWWFGTFFIFHFIYGIILPIDELIFFKMVIAPPTCWNPGQLGSLVREYYIIIYIYLLGSSGWVLAYFLMESHHDLGIDWSKDLITRRGVRWPSRNIRWMWIW